MTTALTDEAIAALKARIGQPRPSRQPWLEEATKDAIRHHADGIGDYNPLWRDEGYARGTRLGGIVAPPFLLYCFGHGGGGGGLPGAHGLYLGDQWEFLQPVRVGDRITHRSWLADVVEKRSRFAGRMVIGTSENEFTNQRGEVVARYRDSHARFDRETEAAGHRPKYADLKIGPYTKEQLDAIEAGYLAEERRGASPRYWEDVGEGDDMQPVVKGPLMVSDVIMWLRGMSGAFIRSHGERFEFFRRHPAAAIMDHELGVPDVPERVHWDSALARRIGMPAAYDYARQRMCWMGHLITNWMGDDGSLRRLETQVRQPNFIGDTTWCKGKVLRKYIEGDEHRVECDVWAENQRGDKTLLGKAAIQLPTRS